MDENYGLFVVTLIRYRALIDESHMKKFDSLDDFMSGRDRADSELKLYTLEEFFNLLNNDMINIESYYSQIIQLKK